MNKYDLYEGKPLWGCFTGKSYTVVSNGYYENNNGEEVFDIKCDSDGEIKTLDVDYLDEYSEY